MKSETTAVLVIYCLLAVNAGSLGVPTVASNSSSSSVHGCKVPQNTIPFKWSGDDVDPEGYYFPLIDNVQLHSFNSMIGGDEDSVPSTCIRLQWNATHAQFFRGPNMETSESATFRCSLTDPKLWILHCESARGYDHWVHGVRVNPERTWALAYICTEPGETSWTIFSKEPTLSDADRELIFEEVKGLGFQPSAGSFVQEEYSDCF